MAALSARITALRERALALLDVVEEIERVRTKRARVGADWPQEFKDKSALIVGMAKDVLKPEFEVTIKVAADPGAALSDWETLISMRVHDAIELGGEVRRMR